MVTPRHHTPRSDRPTRGAGVAAVAAAKGRPLMPWQRDAADVALEIDPATGLPWYGIVVVTVPRQSGKTKLEGDVADHRCLTVPRARVWITQQTGKDASAWMRDEHFPSLADALLFGRPGSPACRYVLSKRAGSEGVEWRATGSTFRAFAPLRDALHGKQSDAVFVDEAWALDAEQGADLRQAVRPTMATRPGAQLWVVSTKGDDASSFFDDYVDLGRDALADPAGRVALIDYGIGDDVDPEDLDAVADAHPAYGLTIGRAALEDARADFGDDVAGWARSYGNVATRARASAFPVGVWTTASRPRLEVPDRAGIAFDVTPAGDRLAIGAAWRTPDGSDPDAGHAFLEVLHAGPPRRDTPALLAQIARARGAAHLTYDPMSLAVLDLVDAVARHDPHLTLERVTTGQYGGACLELTRGIYTDTVHHFQQPELTDAAQVATKRPMGDGGFGWGRRTSKGSIAELVAVTLALRAVDQLPAPRRSPVILSARRR